MKISRVTLDPEDRVCRTRSSGSRVMSDIFMYQSISILLHNPPLLTKHTCLTCRQHVCSMLPVRSPGRRWVPRLIFRFSHLIVHNSPQNSHKQSMRTYCKTFINKTYHYLHVSHVDNMSTTCRQHVAGGVAGGCLGLFSSSLT